MRNNYLRLTIILLSFFSIIKISGQPQTTGYSNLNDVYSLYFQDEATSDTLWIGTSGGVVYRYSPFGVPDYGVFTRQEDGLGSNFITAIVVDNNGNKFFGSFDNGITVFNEGYSTIYNSSNSPLSNHILCLVKDANGDIWAGTPSGAYRFNGADWDSFNTTTEVPNEVRAMAVDGNIVWFGTFGGGIHSYDVVNLTWTHETQADGNIPSDEVTAIAARNDSLIVGTTTGDVSFYDPVQAAGSRWLSEQPGAAGTQIFALEISNLGEFIASASDGLYIQIEGSWSSDGYYAGQATGAIKFQDNNLWLGFNELKDGVDYYDLVSTPVPYTVTGTQYPGNNEITDIVSNNNEVYFSTPGYGLIIYDGTSWSIIDSDMPSLALNALEVQNDTLWLASNDAGTVYFFEGTWGNIAAIDLTVNDVTADKLNQNRVWCGTSTGGAYSLIGLTLEQNFTVVTHGMHSDEVIAIAVDANNDVWFLHKDGITVYSETNASFDILTLSDLGLSTGILTDIASDSEGGVWIGTVEQGVIEYNAGVATIHTEGLVDNHVFSVYVDQQNIKYFGTANGVAIISGFGQQKLDKTHGLLPTPVTAIHHQNSQNLIWSAGNWGGISSTFIPPITVGISTSPSSDFYCFREPVTLFADVTGGFGPDSYNYSWTSSDAGFTSTNASETIYPEVSLTYALEVNDGHNGNSNTIFLDVVKIDTSKIEGPVNICPNGEILYYSASTETGAVKSYNWSISGGYINSPDLTTPNIEVVWDTNNDAGSLYLYETDENNCSVTQQFDVNILREAVPDIILKNGGQILICTDSGFVYQWYKDEEEIPGATRQFFYLNDAPGGVNGTYYVLMDVGNECKMKSEPQIIDRLMQKAYPVPTSSVLNIDKSDKSAPGRATIRTLYGAIIEEIAFTKNEHLKRLEIDVSKYQPGTYFYTITVGSEHSESGKFIVN